MIIQKGYIIVEEVNENTALQLAVFDDAYEDGLNCGDDNNSNNNNNNTTKPQLSFNWYVVVCSIIISLAGSGLHFLYKATQCDWFVGTFVAVNESVFEHLKLLVFPIILLWFLSYMLSVSASSSVADLGERHIVGLTASIYSSVAFMLVIYFFVLVVFEYEELWFDITLFVVSVMVGQLIGWRCADEHFVRSITFMASVLLLIAGVCFFSILTDFPPQVPLMFQDASNKSAPAFYGRPKVCWA